MTRTHDNSIKGVERRYNYAFEQLCVEVDEMVGEVGANVVFAALMAVLRKCGQDAGMAVCQYQMFLIDELAMMNTVRRKIDEKPEGDRE